MDYGGGGCASTTALEKKGPCLPGARDGYERDQASTFEKVDAAKGKRARTVHSGGRGEEYPEQILINGAVRVEIVNDCRDGFRTVRERSDCQVYRTDAKMTAVTSEHFRMGCHRGSYPRIPSTPLKPLDIVATPIDWLLMTRLDESVTRSIHSSPWKLPSHCNEYEKATQI